MLKKISILFYFSTDPCTKNGVIVGMKISEMLWIEGEGGSVTKFVGMTGSLNPCADETHNFWLEKILCVHFAQVKKIFVGKKRSARRIFLLVLCKISASITGANLRNKPRRKVRLIVSLQSLFKLCYRQNVAFKTAEFYFDSTPKKFSVATFETSLNKNSKTNFT